MADDASKAGPGVKSWLRLVASILLLGFPVFFLLFASQQVNVGAFRPLLLYCGYVVVSATLVSRIAMRVARPDGSRRPTIGVETLMILTALLAMALGLTSTFFDVLRWEEMGIRHEQKSQFFLLIAGALSFLQLPIFVIARARIASLNGGQ